MLGRRVARRVKRLTATNWLYLVLHVLLFGAGIALAPSDRVWLSGVGTSLLASGVAGWVLFLWVMLNENQARRMALLTKMGLVDAFDTRAATIRAQYDDRLAHVRESIDVMGFGLRQLREDYGDSFESWSKRATVRVLLIDPQVPTEAKSNADQRDLEEGNAAGSISTDVAAFLSRTESIREAADSRFQVRLYTALPSVNIFRVDDALFWGPYLVRRQSRNTPTFLVERGGILYDNMRDHFDRLWDDPSLSREP